MAVEYASVQAVTKPWGRADLRPWSEISEDGAAIGELWFQRASPKAPEPALLLKLLFTTQPLSIQVHPDDEFAQSIGLPNGKTEAWYILAAVPGAKVALGLKQKLTAAQLRAAIADGSISGQVQWQRVVKDDILFVPAGTIHDIGAGLVIAEIQQRSDTTFRLFDFGRARELHAANAAAVAVAGPATSLAAPRRLTDCRTLLVANPHFVLERINLPAQSTWDLRALHETWLLVLEGHARIGLTNTLVGEAIFLEDDHASVKVGSEGMTGLLAYVAAEPLPGLLCELDGHQTAFAMHASSQPALHRQPDANSQARIAEVRS